MKQNLDDVYAVVDNSRALVLKKWLDSESILPIIDNMHIDKTRYGNEIANSVLDYFLGIINNEKEIGDCPVMRQVVETFLDSGLCVEDVFLNCTVLKNVIVEILYESSVDKKKVRLVTTILDTNLHRILGIYTQKRVMRDKRSALYSKLIEEHVALSITDTNGVMTYVTSAFCTLTGYDAKELLGKTHKIIRHEDMSDNIFKAMWKRLNQNRNWKGKIKNRKKDGGEFIAKTEIIPFENEDGKVFEYIAIRHDITDKELSNIDPLTGLFNRRVYEDNIGKIIDEYENISLMVVDIDHFKNINDSYGHSFGDLVLKEFAKILTSKIREKDLCVRWGGEEFVILLPDTYLDKASEIAERIRVKIDDLIILDKNSNVSVDVKCSIGVTQYYASEDEDSFFNRADSNLYIAKNRGRNMVVSD